MVCALRMLLLLLLQPKVLDEFGEKVISTTDESIESKYRRNLMMVEIYYEEFNYENIDERPSYTVSSIIMLNKG